MVSPETRTQLRRLVDTDGTLALLTITNPGIDTIRIVDDTRSWTIGGITYLGLPFRFRLPVEAGGQAMRALLEMDNVGREVTAELEKLPPGSALQATLRLVSRARPEVVDEEFTAPLSGVSVTTATVSSQLGNDEALQAPAVKMRYDPATTPDLFEG